jgi:hypothetical protein
MSNKSFESIKTLVETLSIEEAKFWEGNNSAGTRARKALQEIIKAAREGRKTIQEEKNNRKNK